MDAEQLEKAREAAAHGAPSMAVVRADPEWAHSRMTFERMLLAELLDALDAAEARAERAERESDELQGDIDDMSSRWHDAVADIHRALGGDGEWKAHAGAQPPIEESGHLHLASKAMAENLVAERDRLRDQANDWHKVADDRAAEIVRLRESLEAEISKAFDAGSAYSVGSHRDFKQIHPNRKEYVRQVLNRPECREVGGE